MPSLFHRERERERQIVARVKNRFTIALVASMVGRDQ